jgi:2-haloacid dehalogenase
MAAEFRIQTFIFDAYGTLFDPFSVESRCEKFFPGHGAAVSRLWRAKQLEYTWLRSLMGRYEDFWKVTRDALIFACRSLKLAPKDSGLDELMATYLTLGTYSDVAPGLEALSRLPLRILSNGSPRMLEAVVANAGLQKMFTGVLSVDAVRIYKPNPAVYQMALLKADLPKEDIGFVSSNFWDICGAGAFGFRTFWLNRSGAIPEELDFRPTTIVRSLSELATQTS